VAACQDATVSDDDIAELVAAAAGGDERAWSELVRRYSGLVLATVRAVRLPPEDVKDVGQVTWLQLATHIRSLRDPLAIAGWLATTARHEAIRLARRRRQEQRLDDEHAEIADPHAPPLDEGLLRDEGRARVRRGFAKLSERCQRLLGLLARDPPLSYTEISAAMDMPIGSIGPTRARCLDRLRQAAGLSAY
jgi:RNA polymerase sigma factor (sigma-70 family)